MTIEDKDAIDFLGLSASGAVVLTISNHLEWKKETLFKLQKKISVYLSFIESGDIYKSYPEAEGKTVRIHIVSNHQPDTDTEIFIKECCNVVNAAGFELTHEVSVQT
jgi:hypothetical protein